MYCLHRTEIIGYARECVKQVQRTVIWTFLASQSLSLTFKCLSSSAFWDGPKTRSVKKLPPAALLLVMLVKGGVALVDVVVVDAVVVVVVVDIVLFIMCVLREIIMVIF